MKIGIWNGALIIYHCNYNASKVGTLSFGTLRVQAPAF